MAVEQRLEMAGMYSVCEWNDNNASSKCRNTTGEPQYAGGTLLLSLPHVFFFHSFIRCCSIVVAVVVLVVIV